MTLGIYVEVCSAGSAISMDCSARKNSDPDRGGYSVIIPDALSVLCHFANGAEGSSNSAVSTLMHWDCWKFTARPGLGLRFHCRCDQSGRVGDRALHEVEVRWNSPGMDVENDFLDAVKAGDDERPSPTFEDGCATCE